MSSWKGRAPCRACGNPKPPGPGRKYCDPCADKLRPIFEQERYKQRLARRQQQRQKSGEGRKLAHLAPDGQKWCARCQQYLPVDEFSTSGAKPAAYCKPCNSAYAHERVLARDYNLTPEGYQALLDLQNGRCAVCERKPRSRRLAVDHDHDTGEVRGLLCARCNHKVIGAANESAATLRRAARYLDSPPAQTMRPVPATDDDFIALRMEQWVEEQDAAHTKDRTHLWIKRRGKASPGDAYVVMTGDQFTELLKKAGW